MGSARARHDTDDDDEGVGTELVLPGDRTPSPAGDRGGAFEVVATALARALGLESGPRVPTRARRGDDEAARELLRAVWAIDSGRAIRSLPTGSLWVAVARGDVSPRDRVWREGMECWEPLEAVPELACVLGDRAPSAPPPESHARSPEPPRAEPRRATAARPGRPTRDHLVWIGGGTAVAAASVAIALVTTAPPPPATALGAPAPWATVVARSADAAPREAPGAIAASPPPPTEARARKHVDPGQRRSRAHRP